MSRGRQAVVVHDIIIAVATVAGDATYLWTEKIIRALEQIAEKELFTVRRLGIHVNEVEGSAAARERGEAVQADFVIWGYASATDVAADVTVYFEVCDNISRHNPWPSWSWNATRAVGEVKSFSLQAEVSQELCDLMSLTAGIVRQRVGKLSKALTNFSHLLERDTLGRSQRALVYLARANCYERLGDFGRAIQDYTAAIEARPLRTAYLLRGVAYWTIRSDRALEDYEHALETPATDLDRQVMDYPEAAPYYVRGTCQVLSQGEPTLAVQDLGRAIELVPKDYYSHLNRGHCFRAMGRFDEALRDFYTCIEIDPRRGEAYNNRGGVYRCMGEFGLAHADYARAIKLEGCVGVYLNRAILFAHQQRWGRGLIDLHRYITKNPSDADGYLWRGRILILAGALTTWAVADLTRAIDLSPRNVEAYQLRRLAYRKLGRIDEAERDEALVLDLTRSRSDFAWPSASVTRANPLYVNSWPRAM